MTAFLEYITATCRAQEDFTGTDDLHFYVNNDLVGRLTIATGETLTLPHSDMLQDRREMTVDSGGTLAIYESDLLDPNDLLLSYTFTESDLASTDPLTLGDTSSSADYTFEVRFDNRT